MTTHTVDAAALEALLRRLARLEMENRRLKRRGAAALLAVAALGGAVAATQGGAPDVVEAREFVIRDADGQVRGTLGAAGGQGVLRLINRNGTVSVELGGGSRPFPGSGVRLPPER